MASLITIPARQGKAITLRRGQHQGHQHPWPAGRRHLGLQQRRAQCMSMEHTRTALSRIMVRVGDSLVTNQRRPILTLVEDTSPGIHDTRIACDRYRYVLLGPTYHETARIISPRLSQRWGYRRLRHPSPWNLFMNIPVQADGSLTFEPPVCKPSYICYVPTGLRVAFSACPQDIVPINEVACTPTEAHLELV